MAVQSSGGGMPSLDDADVQEQGAFVDINVTPLVDIFLVLLVILMATSTAILEQGSGAAAGGFKVELPTGAKSDEVATGGNELVIAILKDGEIIARGEQVSLDELKVLLDEEAAKGKERLVLVQADEESLHRRVVEVMEAARNAGLKNLGIATKPE